MRRRLLNKWEATLVVFNAALLPPSLWASGRLLSAAVATTMVRVYWLAALALFVNNSIAAALVTLASLTMVRFAWAWGLSEDAITRNAGKVSAALTTGVFALSLAMRLKLISAVLFLLPHFWLEYIALALAAYAGFRSSPKHLALSFAVLALAAAAEVGVAALRG
jgi:uncharacterized membrane protein SpoIIM required for sporulation